jgi:hypothetical protein
MVVSASADWLRAWVTIWSQVIPQPASWWRQAGRASAVWGAWLPAGVGGQRGDVGGAQRRVDCVLAGEAPVGRRLVEGGPPSLDL